MNYFCTYFDHRYLPRGIALYRSLKEHCLGFNLWILCLSRECHEILSQINLDSVYLIRVEDIEDGDKELLKAKENRSLVEYYFTLTPSLPLYIFNRFSKVDLITYIDSDLYFFSNPKPIYDELGKNSIGIIGHRFPPHLRHLNEKGVYNVGWMSFCRDKNGLDCLQWYRERCNEWCYDRVEGDRYADQKYLDKFEELFAKVHVIQHKGANLAPWDIANYKISEKNNQILVDEQTLIFFHFHGLKKLVPSLYDSGFADYQAEFSKIVRDKIYLPYIKIVEEEENSFPPIVHEKLAVIRGGTRFEYLKKVFPRVFNVLEICKRILIIMYTKTYICVPPKKEERSWWKSFFDAER